ncbi:MAG: hypothetical protein ACR2NZ_20905, partial [Rubripirellula sp.]
MSEESSAPNDAPKPRKGISKGMLSALGIIAVVLALMAYDHFVAGPSTQAAFDQIVKESIQVKMVDEGDEPGVLTNTTIHEIIGKTPVQSYDDDLGDTVEVFQWGIPGKKHKMFVVYNKNEEGKLNFFRHSLNSYSKGNGIVV